jgi:hypothetical protein
MTTTFSVCVAGLIDHANEAQRNAEPYHLSTTSCYRTKIKKLLLVLTLPRIA